MSRYLEPGNFSGASPDERQALERDLARILREEWGDGPLAMLGPWQRLLADNDRRQEWDAVFAKLRTLFLCGESAPPDGPMIGVPMAIRDSDYFRETARLFDRDRSLAADIEWMATCWNAAFAGTGLWMGKTFEPIRRETFAARCDHDADTVAGYSPETTRIGRNFFRETADPNLLQGIALPALTRLWRLKDRPTNQEAAGFAGELLSRNLEKERVIPYTKTGGIFLAQPGRSLVPELKGKAVYQLNYRWPRLEPVYPMTRLVDELVRIADGIWLGQLVMATRHYSLGSFSISLLGERSPKIDLGEAYRPGRHSPLDHVKELLGGKREDPYGYQNNGFFLMIDSSLAREAYAEAAFPHLRPRPGEAGYAELGFRPQETRKTAAPSLASGREIADWQAGWQQHERLHKKFTSLCLEPSPKKEDADIHELLAEGESILQMLQRIQGEIARQSSLDDHLRHFEKLNRLFRCGIAPTIKDGLFQGRGRGYNSRFDAPEKVLWYGKEEPCRGYDHYHGATLNLHLGFGDTFREDWQRMLGTDSLFPGALACLLQKEDGGPNVLNAVWANIGRFIFPWAGKSFQRISPGKLSMFLDESQDLAERYPERVAELAAHPASWPHYDLVRRSRDGYWPQPGAHAEHLAAGPWDNGMNGRDRDFWRQEADCRWLQGMNLQDDRILPADTVFRALDMNYGPLLPSIRKLAAACPSPFVRQGYMFLGAADRDSLLPMNRGKKVFQFHYRFPLIGGPAPIGTCLDELVEIAEGLFLGQLIYSTALFTPFRSSVDPAEYRYQLFGYFLLLDDEWERHRQAIGLDNNRLV
ncbi:hypothetical protein ACUUL3_10375 [Thiovibrio sp. JS02]